MFKKLILYLLLASCFCQPAIPFLQKVNTFIKRENKEQINSTSNLDHFSEYSADILPFVLISEIEEKKEEGKEHLRNHILLTVAFIVFSHVSGFFNQPGKPHWNNENDFSPVPIFLLNRVIRL